MKRAIRDRFDHRLWLVPFFAAQLGRAELPLVQALAAAARNPRIRTVDAWAKALGFQDREELERQFRRHSHGQPKRLLVCFRLAQAVCERHETGAARDAIANALSYPSGDYLGRRCRLVTGRPFGELAAGGLPEVALLLRNKLRS